MNTKNYRYIANILAITLVFSMVILEPAEATDSVVIKNNVSSSHSTGGQSSNGADGTDGAPGKDGADGVDGANGVDGRDGVDSNTVNSNGNSRAQIITTINGDTVTQNETTSTEGAGSAEVVSIIETISSSTASSTVDFSHPEGVGATTTSIFSLKSAFLSLRLILINYVNLLF